MLSVITYILPPVRKDCQKDTKEETMEEEYFLHINWFASSDDHLQVVLLKVEHWPWFFVEKKKTWHYNSQGVWLLPVYLS